MEQSSNEDPQNRLLQLLTAQNETTVKLLEKQNTITEKQSETIEKMREEHSTKLQEQNAKVEAQNTRTEAQNTRIEELTTAVKTLVETSSSNCELVSLMKELISSVRTLENNSILDRDDKPFPIQIRGSIHEHGWRAAFETLTAKMKDQVERWRNGMDSTLIFVALFVTVITAFQAPVSQNLSPNPVDLTNSILGNLTTMVYEIALLNGLKVPGGLPGPEPFRPDRTDQVVTLFSYTALLLSLIAAILSVFGRQWVEHLTTRPDGQSYKDRSWRVNLRLELAEKLLRPLLDSLQPILIVSIVLFIVGLLFQLWAISFSAGKPSVLMLTSSLGSALIVGTAAVTVYTFVHGVRQEESPFTTSTSLVIRRRLPPGFQDIKSEAVSSDEEPYRIFCSAVKEMGETHHFDQVSTVTLRKLFESEDSDQIELAVYTIISVLGSDASLKAKQTIAWILCRSLWWIKEEVREKCVECHRRLYEALDSADSDTPSSQRKIQMTFFVARLVVLLKFSGSNFFLINLENAEIKRALLTIFNFDPKICIDEEIFRKVKIDAHLVYLDLATQHPDLFDDVIDDEFLLPAILEEEVSDNWKYLIVQHLNGENITKFLDILSTESLKENANCPQLIKFLSLVLWFCKLPFVFPENFDISNLIKFATIDERRFDTLPSIVPLDVFTCNTPVDVILSCLSLMDDTLLDAQQDLVEFLDLLDGHEQQILGFRDEIPLTPASIIELRYRVALSALPLFWQWTS